MFKSEVTHISDKVIFHGRVLSVILPGVMGQFEVGEMHAPIVSLLTRGEIIFRTGKREARSAMIQQGLMRFDGYELYAVVE